MSRIPKKSLSILLKAVLLFVAFNYAFALVPDSALWRISLYNTIFPGKTRFFLEKDLDLMFDTHEIATSASHTNEYKVILLGDSSVWGYKLNPAETLTDIINQSHLLTCKGQTIHVYNLGYPVPLVFRDTLILQRALTYKPDLILWNITLLSMLETKDDVRYNIIIKNNADLAQNLNDQYRFVKKSDLLFKRPPPPDQTFLGRRAELARLIKAQLEEVRWLALGGELVDKAFVPLGMDVEANSNFDRYKLAPPKLNPALLQFHALNAAQQMVGNIPIVFINEPIQVVNGENSAVRYNEMYPRWVYDQYRKLMEIKSKQYHWNYIDLWNFIPPAQFTDSTFHRTTKGEQLLAQRMQEIILENSCR